METYADKIIDGLGGTTAVAKMLAAPASTVHSWRKNGIPRSRLAHLKLAAHAAGKRVDWDAIEPAAKAA
jgi:hypothetical protein